MNRLQRHLAPMSDAAWAAVEEEARSSLRTFLAARHLVDVSGPRGWELAGVPTGRTRDHDGGLGEGLRLRARETRPVLELRAELTLSRSEIELIDRGGEPDLEPVVDAARRGALGEDRAVLHGSGDLDGIARASEHPTVPIPAVGSEYPGAVADAVELLRDAGVEGPYGIALGPKCWNIVYRATEEGFPIVRHLRELLDGPLMRAPAVDGAIVLSLRGGDVELVLGSDWALGYVDHDAGSVRLFLEESIAWRVLDPAVGVVLAHP